MDEQQTSGEAPATPALSDVVIEPVVNVPPDAAASDAPAPDPVPAVADTLPPDPVSDNTTLPPASTAETAPLEPETVPTVPDVVLEPIAPPPAPVVEPTPIAPAPELPVIQIDPALPVDASSSAPVSPQEPEVQIVERVVEKEVVKEVPVEKIVEREVIKEVPVEKIVEKVVYRDPAPLVCPPPTAEEREAIERDFLIELSHEGTARKHALMLEKKATILTLFETKDHLMHKDVMDALVCSGTTATRLLTELRHEGKLFLHGTGGNGATYTKI